MADIVGHYWEEIVPPRPCSPPSSCGHGTDTEMIHFLECAKCKKGIMVRTSDIKYIAISVGQKS